MNAYLTWVVGVGTVLKRRGGSEAVSGYQPASFGDVCVCVWGGGVRRGEGGLCVCVCVCVCVSVTELVFVCVCV